MRGIILFSSVAAIGFILWFWFTIAAALDNVALVNMQMNAATPGNVEIGSSEHQPPVRFKGAVSSRVSFGTVSACGKPKDPKKVFAACVRATFLGPVVHLPNPCDHVSEGDFARRTCHELGHLNGWSGEHED